jgi:hypothetical protein
MWYASSTVTNADRLSIQEIKIFLKVLTIFGINIPNISLLFNFDLFQKSPGVTVDA